MADFKPSKATCKEILRRLAGAGSGEAAEIRERRATLEERLRRARDLYELGDLSRPEYMARRDAINSELAALAPEPIPDLDQARKVLEDFTIFWRRETDPLAKRQLLSLIFERVWLDEQRVVAVRPKTPFVPFFERHRAADEHREMADSVPGIGVCKERERRGGSGVCTSGS
jgi:hypothetical protein